MTEADQFALTMKETAPTRDLLTYFDELHVQRTGVRAVIHGGKDAKLIAGLWKSHGTMMVRALMADFFASKDHFIIEAGFSVGVFISQAPKLIARMVRAPRVSWFDECDHLHGGSCSSAAAHFHRKDKESA